MRKLTLQLVHTTKLKPMAFSNVKHCKFISTVSVFTSQGQKVSINLPLGPFTFKFAVKQKRIIE
jgi:outer membrane protein assembly factor BamA